MNITAIRQGISTMLSTVVGDAYVELPANPVFPCITIAMPVVRGYHWEYGHDITRTECLVTVWVGKGDLADTQDQLGQYVSTDTPQSVLGALEADPPDPAPWLRLKVVSTSDLQTDANALGVGFLLEIDS